MSLNAWDSVAQALLLVCLECKRNEEHNNILNTYLCLNSYF